MIRKLVGGKATRVAASVCINLYSTAIAANIAAATGRSYYYKKRGDCTSWIMEETRYLLVC